MTIFLNLISFLFESFVFLRATKWNERENRASENFYMIFPATHEAAISCQDLMAAFLFCITHSKSLFMSIKISTKKKTNQKFCSLLEKNLFQLNCFLKKLLMSLEIIVQNLSYLNDRFGYRLGNCF